MKQLTGYVPEAASVVETTRSHVAGALAAERRAAASQSATGDGEQAAGCRFSAAAGRECFDLVGIVFATLQKLLNRPPTPLARRSPSDADNHKPWRYHTYRALADAFGYKERTPLPALCEALVKALFPGPAGEPTTGFRCSATATDTGSFKRRTAMGDVAPTWQRLDAASDEQPGDARPVKQARSA